MPKSLFFQDGPNKHRYTPDATTLDYATEMALSNIFMAYETAGYSPREIFYVMSAAVRDMELQAVLGWGAHQPPPAIERLDDVVLDGDNENGGNDGEEQGQAEEGNEIG